jgi:hypothetical protein
METTIPADLLELKARFDQWRATRTHNREPLPTELRQAALAISRRCPRSLVRRLLNFDPWRLQRATTKKSAAAAAPNKRQTAFFQLPPDSFVPQPASVPLSIADCRLQLERPDGARLTLTLPNLDLLSIHRLAADFLRGDRQ